MSFNYKYYKPNWLFSLGVGLGEVDRSTHTKEWLLSLLLSSAPLTENTHFLFVAISIKL